MVMMRVLEEVCSRQLGREHIPTRTLTGEPRGSQQIFSGGSEKLRNNGGRSYRKAQSVASKCGKVSDALLW